MPLKEGANGREFYYGSTGNIVWSKEIGVLSHPNEFLSVCFRTASRTGPEGRQAKAATKTYFIRLQHSVRRVQIS